jgi:hypothetical protein
VFPKWKHRNIISDTSSEHEKAGSNQDEKQIQNPSVNESLTGKANENYRDVFAVHSTPCPKKGHLHEFLHPRILSTELYSLPHHGAHSQKGDEQVCCRMPKEYSPFLGRGGQPQYDLFFGYFLPPH